jgi:general secretion pathway protein K
VTRRCRQRRDGEDGYAILAAIIAIAVLGLMSLSLIDTGRGIALGALSEAERARLAAAADAGLAYAVVNLSRPDRASRWSIDGRARNVSFAGTDLLITVEDEHGKVPLNQLSDEQARALFEELGASGLALAVQTDAFLDWIDDDDEPRANGAEVDYYTPRRIVPRNGELRSVEELLHIRGLTPDILRKLRGKATAGRNQGTGFDDRFATPLALSIMSGSGPNSAAVISRERELAGQRVAIDLAEEESLVGRPLTVRVEARRPGGGHFERATLIELTGRREAPYVVRAINSW